MADITFALVREGTSDDGLVAHIRTLLLKAGATAVVGTARTYKGTTLERLQQVWAEDEPVDMIFVHRDADSRDPGARHQEIGNASAFAHSWGGEVVPVVPVQELEAWLLTDESAIRNVVGKPNGNSIFELPTTRQIEMTASPKEMLAAACLSASGTTGARHRREVRAFPLRRTALLDRLDLSGPVNNLPSWQRFLADLDRSAQIVLASR